MATLAENRQQALNWVNARRAEFELPPLDNISPGLRGHGNDCALGRSLENKCEFFASGDFGEYRSFGDRIRLGRPKTHKLPKPVAVFEYDFERGFYPDLDDGTFFYAAPCLKKPTAEDSPLALTGS